MRTTRWSQCSRNEEHDWHFRRDTRREVLDNQLTSVMLISGSPFSMPDRLSGKRMWSFRQTNWYNKFMQQWRKQSPWLRPLQKSLISLRRSGPCAFASFSIDKSTKDCGGDWRGKLFKIVFLPGVQAAHHPTRRRSSSMAQRCHVLRSSL